MSTQTECIFQMKKLEKFSSFDEMKNSSTSGTVDAAVLMARNKKFESFIHFLRGDDPPEKSLPKPMKYKTK